MGLPHGQFSWCGDRGLSPLRSRPFFLFGAIGQIGFQGCAGEGRLGVPDVLGR